MSTVEDEATLCVIGASGRFEGLLSFRGHARVAGSLSGEVAAEGSLELTETARVDARIEVDELVVAGSLSGEVHARERVELLPTAHVRGRLRTPRLAVADGARLEAQLEMQSAPDAATP